MAEDTVNRAALLGGLSEVNCKTKELPIHGHCDKPSDEGHLYVYGSDIPVLKRIMAEQSGWSDKLHPDLPYLKAEVIWAVRYE
ncbi:FAD-dependent oxidoreductase, partial [Enterococcus hirae]